MLREVAAAGGGPMVSVFWNVAALCRVGGRPVASDGAAVADPAAAQDLASWRELTSTQSRAALAPDPMVAAHRAASQGRVCLPRRPRRAWPCRLALRDA